MKTAYLERTVSSTRRAASFRPTMSAARKYFTAAGLVFLLCGCANAREEALNFQTNVSTPAKPWTQRPAAEPETLRFAVVGDRTGLARPGVFEQAMVQLTWMKPEFVINVGDLLEGYSDDRAELEREWSHIEAAVEKADLPFFYVAGNHDLGTDTQLEMWRERRGEPWYWFKFKNVLFVVLDTEDPPAPMPAEMAATFRMMAKRMEADPVAVEREIALSVSKENKRREEAESLSPLQKARFSEQQIEWAEKLLAEEQDVRWTFVLMHKPAWSLDSQGFERIERALRDRNYTVIAGHNHYYRREIRSGHDYLTMGSTGAVSHQSGPGSMDHIAWITVSAGEPDVSLIKLSSLLDRDARSGQTLAR
ncbi:hypothetical protein GCM10011494_26410 [Novosphingobium endophyticum]|uniref:Calcineurin-like phosphoesterase domain-containing protein n=1 Tax=Novosphingobium endophyticum TaxID=1955250 RepID=A0A916TTE7_9SPHN|nr:metallophosphoesterase [Novosphingobium endophyticum]GGC06525.1 hypothetical protein GCM10011494_26410 [Novosphingobium endophyticum]